MSTQSIARWNAIPMSRPDPDTQEAELEQSQTNSIKRSHQDADDSDDDDDNVSLVSRSPSPAPNAMDIEKYDEYVRGPAREVITVETRIKSSNKGFAMLAKLGWSEGQPLGLSADARVDPIPFQVKNDLTGLGKTTQDFRMIETTVAERRKLDSERQRKETEDQRKAREDDAARKAALKSEITDTLKAFYCALCEKQFQNVAQYDEHTNSYAHHHKARLRDMQANTRMTSQEDVDKRKEKERKREEKELRKIAKAAGIKMAKPTTISVPMPPTSIPAGEMSLSSEAQPSNFKKAGWATVSTTVDPASVARRSGCASLDSSASPSVPVPPPPAPASHSAASATPIFRTGGWTSLDTGSSLSTSSPHHAAPPPPPPPNEAPPPPPMPPMNAPPPISPPPFPPANARPPGGPPPLPSTSAPPPGGRPPFPPTPGGWGSAAPSSDSRRWDHSAPAPTFSQPRSPPSTAAAAILPASGSLKAPVPPPATPQARTGWQQWKRGGSSTKRR